MGTGLNKGLNSVPPAMGQTFVAPDVTQQKGQNAASVTLLQNELT